MCDSLGEKINGYLCQPDPKQARKAAGLELREKSSAEPARDVGMKEEFLGAGVMRRCSLDGKKGLWLELEGCPALGRMPMGYSPRTRSSGLQIQDEARV